MSAFLFLLVKVNLAMGMAIILAALLRRPLRTLFGAPIAYAIWLLVPVAGLAVLLPPRVVVPPPPVSVPPMSFIGHVAPSALGEQLTNPWAGQGVARTIATLPPAAHMPDTALVLFAAWALGAVFMLSYLAWLQLRFAAAMRRGTAGPAVLGFFRPRIVTPDSFETHFTTQEQAAILAHERVHLARQDARINGLAALLRCLCWFNPLIHLGARWLRIDQELACDATVVGRVSRRDYAEALLKSQLVVTALPLGCNWPGSQHPLIERIALLKRKPPGAARRIAGVSLVLFAAGFAGFGAWAAQPPVAAKSVAAPLPRMVALPVPGLFGAPVQTAKAPAAPASPPSSSHEADAPDKVRAERAISLAPVRVQMPSSGSIAAPMQSVAELPPISVALNAPRTFTTAPDTGTDDVVMANTPSGEGEVDAIVCRAPQRITGADQFGPEACGHNWEWRTMAMNGKDLAADGKTLIDKPTVANPTGEGDPGAVTCRTPKSVMRGPVCQTNRFWADLIRHHQTIDMPTVANPTGEGDPDAVTCRTPKFVIRGPLVEVCETNRFWADIIKKHQMVDARGLVWDRPQPPLGGNVWGTDGVSSAYPDPGFNSGSGYASSGGTFGGYHP